MNKDDIKPIPIEVRLMIYKQTLNKIYEYGEGFEFFICSMLENCAYNMGYKVFNIELPTIWLFPELRDVRPSFELIPYRLGIVTLEQFMAMDENNKDKTLDNRAWWLSSDSKTRIRALKYMVTIAEDKINKGLLDE